PLITDSDTTLPGFFHIRLTDGLLRCEKVAHGLGISMRMIPLADAVVDNELRVQFLQIAVYLFPIFQGPIFLPVAIKPKHKGMILRYDLPQFHFHGLYKFGHIPLYILCTVIRALCRIVRIVPVQDGEIDTKGNTLSPAGLRQLLYNIPLERTVADV